MEPPTRAAPPPPPGGPARERLSLTKRARRNARYWIAGLPFGIVYETIIEFLPHGEELRKHLGVSALDLAVAICLGAAAGLPGTWMLLTSARRIGLRQVTIAMALALAVVMLAGALFVTSTVEVVAVATLTGLLGQGFPLCFRWVDSQSQDQTERARMATAVVFGIQAAVLVGSMADLFALAHWHDWRWGLVLQAALLVISACLLACIMPAKPLPLHAHARRTGGLRIRAHGRWNRPRLGGGVIAPAITPATRLVAFVAILGAGKSTITQPLTEQLPDAVVICADEIRGELGDEADQAHTPRAFKIAFDRLRPALDARQTVIWDATNTQVWARRKLVDAARRPGRAWRRGRCTCGSRWRSRCAATSTAHGRSARARSSTCTRTSPASPPTSSATKASRGRSSWPSEQRVRPPGAGAAPAPALGFPGRAALAAAPEESPRNRGSQSLHGRTHKMMSKSDRAWLIAGAMGAAIWFFALLLAMTLIPRDASRGGVDRVLLLVTAGTVAVAISIAAVWSRIEDALEQRDTALEALLKEMRAQTRSAAAAQGALERGVRLIEDGALSWGAGAARGAQRVRVEYEDQAMEQLATKPRQRRPRMRLIHSGLDLLANEIRGGRTVEAGLRLEGDTVQVLELVDDTVVIAIRATAGSYLAVHGQPREDWHAFTVAQVAPLTDEQARQHGIALT